MAIQDRIRLIANRSFLKVVDENDGIASAASGLLAKGLGEVLR